LLWEITPGVISAAWAAVQADVRPFLELEHDVELVTPKALSQLLRDAG